MYLKISIITPVYKAEKFLKRCVESILAQTYTNWELILVDDGSPDKSGDICDNYANADNRIKVIHKPNGGVSTARNCGIEQSSGDWICFVDSDDWVDESYLQNFIDAMCQDVDLILQSFYFYYASSNNKQAISISNRKFNKSAELVAYLNKADVVHNGFLWHRLFKRCIIEENKIQFIEDFPFAEDGCFCLKYLLHCKMIVSSDKAGYNYVVNDSGLTKAGKTLPYSIYKRLCDEFFSLISIMLKKDMLGSDVEDELNVFFWNLVVDWLFERSAKDYNLYKKSCRIASNYGAIEKPHNIRNGYIQKMLINTISLSPSLYSYYRYRLLETLKINYKRVNNILKRI